MLVFSHHAMFASLYRWRKVDVGKHPQKGITPYVS